MMTTADPGPSTRAKETGSAQSTAADTSPHLRFLEEYQHLASPFGTGGFGEKAEAFARFFGTPTFLIGQTIVVAGWIVVNATHIVRFDLYPFILLNLAFSLQAAYAAPLILLAQTRQADRDKAVAEADARHREAVADNARTRQAEAETGIEMVKRLIDENTELTKQVNALTREIHGKLLAG
jgi:uncharacterized membrane protein